MDNAIAANAGWIMMIIGAFVTGLGFGLTIATRDMQKQAVERGFARHNETTGHWEWK